MEKLREIVIKLANNAPNKPLSESHNTFIHHQFDQLLSVLHTPDHPPYAWMIQKALEELNEKGGSSEVSISDFIRKEYHDLPWSHLTLLEHHLQALSECGDIILTSRQHYLLAGADSTLKSGKRGRGKSRKKKRDRDWIVKRRKQRKKDIDKVGLLQKEDQAHENQNCMLEGVEHQDKEPEARNDTPELYILVEKNGEQTEGDQTKIPTPERPPGFESAVFAESSHRPVCYRESPSNAMYPTRSPPDVEVSAAEDLSGHQEQIHVLNVYDQLKHEEEQMILSVHGAPETSVDQILQDVQPTTTINSIDLLETNNEESLGMPSQASPIEERCSQKKASELELKKDADAILETGPVNSTGDERVTCIVFKYQKRQPATKADKLLSCMIGEIKDEVLQQNGLKCQGQQLQGHGLLSTDELQEVKSGEAKRSEHQGLPIVAVKPSCEEPHCPQEIAEVLDSSRTASPLLQYQPQEHEISEANKLQEMKSGTADISDCRGLSIPAANPKPSCEEDHQSEAPIGVTEGPAVSSKLSVCSKWPNGGDAREFSDLPKVSVLEAGDIEEAFPISSKQWQGKCLRKQLSNRKRPQVENDAPLESGRLTRKRAKLYSQDERNGGQLKVSLPSTVVLKRANSRTFSRLASSKMHPEIELQTETSNQLSQEKPSFRGLRPRPLKPEPSDAPESLPSSHQRVEQQPKQCGRPPKAKSDNGITNDNVVPVPKRRGRPPKYNKKLQSGTQQDRPRNLRRGRSQKAAEEE